MIRTSCHTCCSYRVRLREPLWCRPPGTRPYGMVARGDTEKYVRQQSGRHPSFFSSVEGSAVGATRGASVDQHLSIHAVGA